jgi:hypothetical protein
MNPRGYYSFSRDLQCGMEEKRRWNAGAVRLNGEIVWEAKQKAFTSLEPHTFSLFPFVLHYVKGDSYPELGAQHNAEGGILSYAQGATAGFLCCFMVRVYVCIYIYPLGVKGEYVRSK